MPGPTLIVALAPPDLDEARRQEFAADLKRRLDKTGTFRVTDLRQEPPEGRRSGFAEVDRLHVEAAEAPAPGLDEDGSVALGERLTTDLVATVRPWLADVAPHVTNVVVRHDDVALTIDANGASDTEMVALARAYAEAARATGG